LCTNSGDLWSYNREYDSFIVSPEPDVSVHTLDRSVHRCIIIASDGVWNMVSAADAVSFVDRWLHQRNKLLELVSVWTLVPYNVLYIALLPYTQTWTHDHYQSKAILIYPLPYY